jgi:WD40 repeat protein
MVALPQPDSPSLSYRYQVGGSLHPEAPTYVVRQADRQLYDALKQGQFCYVFNARQVGKSSLRVRVKTRLEAEGYRCAAIDMTSIGSETVTPQQWYKGLAAELWRGFGLSTFKPFKVWWQEQGDIGAIQCFVNLIQEVILEQFAEPITIFLDEIDAVLNLPFSVDDFFAWIRFCYDHRPDDPRYQRLTFVLLGVTTPTDLIRAHTRTPFNIGTAIELSGFCQEEALPLAAGLQYAQHSPTEILQAILAWTEGQPFLTQKICQLWVNHTQKKGNGETNTAFVNGVENPLPPQLISTEATEVEQLVTQLIWKEILCDWKRFDEPEHLRTIRDRLLADETLVQRLLGMYRCILQGEKIRTSDSREQLELLLSGLVIRQQGQLQVKCRLYQEVFNLAWVQHHLDQLRPYAAAIQIWLNDPTDESRLLRGKALADAQTWAEAQRLGDDDYRFLAASEALDRRISEEALQLARAQEVANRLAVEQKSNAQKRRLITALTGLLGISLGLGGLTYAAYQRATRSEQETALAAVQAQVALSQSFFGSNQRLNALVSALQAKHQLDRLNFAPTDLMESVDSALRKAVYRAVERNRFQHGSQVRGVDISPDGQLIAVAGADGVINLWNHNGLVRAQFQQSNAIDNFFGVKFSPNGQTLASVSSNGSLKLWDVKGKLLLNFQAHPGGSYGVTYSPDGRKILTAGADGTVKVWNLQGKLLQILAGHTGEVWGVAISPDGQLIASGSRDRTVRLWRADGQLLHTLTGYQGTVRGLAFSPDSQTLVTGSDDNTVKIWNRNGQLMSDYRAHDDAVQAVVYDRLGQFFVTASWDKSIRVWSPDGRLLRQLSGNQDRVWAVAISPDDATIISGSWDKTVRLWELRNTLTTTLIGHTAAVIAVAFSPDGNTIASTGDDQTVRLWRSNGTAQAVLRGHAGETYDVGFSRNGQYIVSAGLDKTLKLWNRQGQLIRNLTGHKADIWSVTFSADSRWVLSGSFDGTAKLWSVEGNLLRTFQDGQARVQDIAISRNRQWVAAAGTDGIARVWSVEGRLQATLKGHTAGLWSVNFSPDGQMLVTSSADNTIKLWHLDGRLIRTIPAHTGEVSDVQFSPTNGQILASSSFDGTIKLWKLDGTLITTLEGHQGRVWGIAWNPNGLQIASAGEDKLVLVWDLDKVQNVNQVQNFGCRWLQDYLRTNPQLTTGERQLCRS